MGAWGNWKIGLLSTEYQDWFKQKLTANLQQAFSAGCMTLEVPEYCRRARVHLYTQSSKHKTYNPRCFFNEKLAMTHIARFYPMSSIDLIEMLGLKGESDLPEFLRGWRRDLGWSTAERKGSNSGEVYQTGERWSFAGLDRETSFLEATVCVNRSKLGI